MVNRGDSASREKERNSSCGRATSDLRVRTEASPNNSMKRPRGPGKDKKEDKERGGGGGTA